MDGGAAGFWSYAHADNEDDGGGILRLAAHLRAEYSLITGDSLSLFTDRRHISWGDEWAARIDATLVETTFFVPVITPRYFRSEACRHELHTFTSQAESLGIGELVLPILYSDIPGLTSENPDAAVALVARRQYVDWRSLRLVDPHSADYRSAVNSLARRLVEIAEVVACRQVIQEVRQSEAETRSEELDLPEIFDQLKARLPEWLDSVENDKFVVAQHHAVAELYLDRRDTLLARNAAAGALFAEDQRFAIQELPIAQQHLALAQVYFARTAEIDPLVARVTRAVGGSPELAGLLTELIAALDEARPGIQDSMTRPGRRLMSEVARDRGRNSRVWRDVGRAFAAADQLVSQANGIVTSWADALAAAGLMVPWDEF